MNWHHKNEGKISRTEIKQTKEVSGIEELVITVVSMVICPLSLPACCLSARKAVSWKQPHPAETPLMFGLPAGKKVLVISQYSSLELFTLDTLKSLSFFYKPQLFTSLKINVLHPLLCFLERLCISQVPWHPLCVRIS